VSVLRYGTVAALVVLTAAWSTGAASARGGRYVFDGGTARQQAQVRAALDVSSFDWSIVPATVRIHLHRGTDTYATRGEIWIDTDLLASGVFAWGPIQHEYAHQVDFFLLDDAQRGYLNGLLGGTTWARDPTKAALHRPGHAALGAERFASTLAWAYWESDGNSLRPSGPTSESAAMAPQRFRVLMERMLGVANPEPPVVTVG
jgi:hypothetical protein